MLFCQAVQLGNIFLILLYDGQITIAASRDFKCITGLAFANLMFNQQIAYSFFFLARR